MDSDPTLIHLVEAQRTPIGSVNQRVSLACKDAQPLLVELLELDCRQFQFVAVRNRTKHAATMRKHPRLPIPVNRSGLLKKSARPKSIVSLIVAPC